MQLHAAASRGDLEGLEFALRAGTDVNSLNCLDQTALVFALERAKAFSRRCGPKVTLEIVEALLDAGADVEATDRLENTAIHQAAGIPNPEFLSLFLQRGGNPKHVTKSEYSVLLSACFQPASPGKHAIIERLYEAGASLDARSVHGEFPLGVCLRFGDFVTLRHLIELGADPGPLNWTELHHAVALKKLDNINQLSPTISDINTPNRRFELSPWQLAFIRGNPETIRLLADRGGDLTQIGRCGMSLLHLAAEFGHEETICWLLDLGADANIKSDFGGTPLHEAAEGNHLDSAKVLLANGADASPQNQVQDQPIHSAHSVEMIQLLVESGGADVNQVNGCGEWPLQVAAQDNDIERIAWLLKHGAEVDLTSTGETALHSAVRFDCREAVEALLEAGANPNAQDVDGETPLFGAFSVETIHALRKAGADPKITDQANWGPEKFLKDPIIVRALREKI